VYLEEEGVERKTLRQGDIVSSVHLLGAINLNGIHYSSTAGNPDEKASWMVPTKPKYGDVMVLSHSCEVALENAVKVTSIILAPLRDINTATNKSRIEELIESNLVDQSNPNASFLKYFYLSPNQRFEFQNGAIVDFSKCFSVRKQSYQLLVENKTSQLTTKNIQSMALKLALYFHRVGNLVAA